MSYRITGPNLDKTMSATETKSVLCANKMMSDNIVISRVTSESENLVITGPNLSKTDTTGTILCANKMMSGNVTFAHTGKIQIYNDSKGTAFGVIYNSTTISSKALITNDRQKTLTLTIDGKAGDYTDQYKKSVVDIYGNELMSVTGWNVPLTYTFTPDVNTNAICIYAPYGAKLVLATGTLGLTHITFGITSPSGSDTGYYVGSNRFLLPSNYQIARSGDSTAETYYPRNVDCKLEGYIDLAQSEDDDKFYYNLTLDGVSVKSGSTQGSFKTGTLKINAANLHALWRGKERIPSWEPSAFVWTTS